MQFCADVWTENERIPWRLFLLSGGGESGLSCCTVLKRGREAKRAQRYRRLFQFESGSENQLLLLCCVGTCVHDDDDESENGQSCIFVMVNA